MSDYNFVYIKEVIINWYNEQFYNQDEIIISKNTDDTLIIDFNFNKCLAQLSVTKANNNPFQFVYFEAIDFENEKTIYYFYDNENMNKQRDS